MPLIDVILPVKNAGDVLSAALDSLLLQTLRDFRIICLEDGSTDNTASILNDYSKKYRERFLIISTRGIGITRALNRGLEVCSGRFIARMDADDLSFPERFSRQCEFIDCRPKVIAVGGDMLRFGDDVSYVRTLTTPTLCQSALLFFNPISHPALFFRLDNRTSVLRYNEEYEFAQDYDFVTQLSKLGELSNVNKPLLFYRVHRKQISNDSRRIRQGIYADRISLKNLRRHFQSNLTSRAEIAVRYTQALVGLPVEFRRPALRRIYQVLINYDKLDC